MPMVGVLTVGLEIVLLGLETTVLGLLEIVVLAACGVACGTGVCSV